MPSEARRLDPDRDAEPGHIGLRIGQQTFTASLVDRWVECVHYQDFQALLPKGDCSGESRGSASNDQCITANQYPAFFPRPLEIRPTT